MIVSPQEIARIQAGRQTELWLPVQRGSMNQRRPCPVEVGTCVSLQPQAFTKGTKVTVSQPPVLRALLPITIRDARAQGYASVEGATAAWSRAYGAPTAQDEVWVIPIVLGDRTRFFARHAERYLRAKMGGARDYTDDPARGLPESAVPAEDQIRIARQAAAKRALEARGALERGLAAIEAQIRQMSANEGDLDEATRKDLRWLRRRAAQMKARLRQDAAA